MKKSLFIFAAVFMLCSVSIANSGEIDKKDCVADNCGCKTQCRTKSEENNSQILQNEKNGCKKDKAPCFKQEIEDDEYFTYNQCFFDKRYRKMKRTLCLTNRQEKCADNLYQAFKLDMEGLHLKYQANRNKLLEKIECDCDNYKQEKRNLSEYKKEAKAIIKDFRDDIKELLCKNQTKSFNKFQRAEKRKMRKIAKYAVIYKFPCVDCSKK